MYALTAAFIARVEVAVPARPETREGITDEIRTAIAYVTRERMLGILTLFVGAHCALTMAFMGVLPSLATTVLHGGDVTFGALMTAVGLAPWSARCSSPGAPIARTNGGTSWRPRS